jgi:parallel beta-helix repeat protein
MKAFAICARQSLLQHYRIVSLITGLLLLSALGFLLKQPVWNITGKVFASKPASAQETYGLSDYASVRVSDRGNSRVNLADGHDVLAAYSGEDEIKQALQQNLARPLAPCSADFDEDGVADLVIGYAIADVGIITLYRGNVDAIFPNAPEAKQRKARGEFIDSPFLSPARVFKLPLRPDFICAGDFDGDGRMDVVTAMRGSNALCLLAGDGAGSFGAAKQIVLPGSITALKAGEINRHDGLMDIVASIVGAKGPGVIIYEGAEGALRADPEQFALPAQVTDFAFCQFNNEYLNDLVIACGSDLMLLRGRDRKSQVEAKQAADLKTIIEKRSFPFTIRSLEAGDFTGNHQTELSLLSSDGSVYLLSQNKKTKANSIKGLKIEKLLAGAGQGSAQLIKARVSSLPADDLVAVDPANHQVRIIETERREQSAKQNNSSASAAAPVDLVVEGEPVAVLPMRLNSDALNDLIILRIGQSAPAVVPSASNAVINVTSNADNGVGTLRDAITTANGNAGADTINFAIGSGPQTISLATPLPVITEAVTIDGTTQPSFAGTPLIELNGAGVPAGGSGLSISSGNCTVRALAINRFTANIGSGGAGIVVQTGGNNLIEGNFIGTNLAGSAALGNFIGVMASNSSNNTIGGATIGARNVISGNTNSGIIINPNAAGNQIQGNRIGTDVNGVAALGNGADGIGLQGVSNNTIGGAAASARNIISGNSNQGIFISLGATANIVQGNFIGTNNEGNTVIGNNRNGILVLDSPGNTIGGTAAGTGNLISGNSSFGIDITVNNSTGNIAQGNLIGTDASGTFNIGNGNGGIRILNAPNNVIGGAAAAARNVISGNASNGIIASAANGNNIQGNFIGVDISGNAALANLGSGVEVFDSSNVTITGNVISGNGDDGAHLENPSPATGQNNSVRGNFIGTNAAGTAAIPNGDNGVVIVDMFNNIIGGTAPADRNVISGNGIGGNPSSDGVEISGNMATNNSVQGNLIGTDINGTADLGNSGNGIFINNSPNNVIGGTSAGARNIISGNDQSGIAIVEMLSTGNQIQGNFIGTDVTGASALSNGVDGVKIDTAANNTIGGAAAGARNVISGNAANGVLIREATTTGNIIQGNFIGVAFNGATPLANAQQGVFIFNNASGNSIGGTAAGQGNRIAFNTLNGVLIDTGAINNGIQSNLIFSNGQLGIDLNNDGVTPNDANDGDAGANNLQNFPVITSVSSGVGSTTIQGTFNSIQNANFRLEFFSSATCDGSGNGEGQIFIGSTNIVTNGSGNANINVTFPVSVAPGSVVTSTATNTTNNTSEFSQCFSVPIVTCVINCPANIALTASQTQCGAVASYPQPNASAGCGTVTCLPPPGTFFPVGVTTVNCVAQAGPSCSFTIVVLDNTSPIITCPSNVATAAAPGRQNTIVDYPLATATDACGAVTVTCLPPSGTTFPIGTTAVNCAATDSSNNGSLCAFIVTVIDSEPPVIRCPNNIAVDAPSGQNTVAVNYPAPTATDNSLNVVVACIPPPGSAFPLGTTAVNCIATDAAGNRASCGFIVTVSGGPPGVRVIIEGGAAAIDFGSNTPVPVNKKPAKNKNNPCGLFAIQNTGSVTVRLTLDSINRIGGDVVSGKISDPKEADLYLLSELSSDGSETPILVGSTFTLKVREQKNYCLRFNPIIPAVAASVTSLSAPQVVPDLVNSRVTFLVAGGNPLAVNVNAHVETGVKFINPDKPKKAAAVTLSRSGNEFTATFSAFDSNADVRRAKYEFLNANGAVIETIEVEMTQVLKEKNLVRGQSFTVIQRFTGANSHPEVKGVRITVFDGESNVSLTTNNLLQSAQASAFKSQGGSRAANILPPVVRLNEIVP